MSALILSMPDRHVQRPEAEIINFPPQGNTQMSSKLQTSGWIACGAALVLLAATALASFTGGLHIEAGGVTMSVQADMERGVQLIFAAAT
jgi:hypothetical protein